VEKKQRAGKVPPKAWGERLVAQTGKAIRFARRRNGKTAEWLSGEVERIGGGLQMSANTIAKVDNGHRGSVLNVTELLVLAAALNVPPAQLLFPGYPNGEVEYLPGRKTTSKRAIEWFCGQARLPGEDSPTNPGIELVEAVAEHAAATEALALVVSLGLPDEAAERLRRERLERMLDAGQRITELQQELRGEN
jgi:transcriptional regulator with XRE-family HTH domain